MPLDRIRDVLIAPDPATRNALIASHLDTLQDSLTQTQAAVASLRNLLDGGPAGQSFICHAPGGREQRLAAAIIETVGIRRHRAVAARCAGELRATLIAQTSS